MKWNDATSWSRGDVDRSNPETWEAEAGGIRLVVTRHIDLAKTDWRLTTQPRIVDTALKGNKSADEAKAALVLLVRNWLERVLGEFQ